MKQAFSRRTSATVLSLSLLVTVHGQKKFVINGEVGSENNGKVIMLTNYKEHSQDSVIVKNGTFHLKGTCEKPRMMYIEMASAVRHADPKPGDPIEMPDGQSFYLAEGVTTIKGKELATAIIDNPVQKVYMELTALRKPFEDQIGTLQGKIYVSKDKDSIRTLKTEAKGLREQLLQAELGFVRRHPGSYVAFDVARDRNVVIEDAAGFEAMFNTLSPRFQQSEDGVKMKSNIAVVKRVSIGQPAIDFTQNDVNDKPVSLSSLKGKYVLVDFWASWCGPCRMEYPYLHKAYDKYKDKNFEILGVSLDSKKDIWVKSIKENDFQWQLVCDLKGFKNEAALIYGVHAIPQSFLVDPQGTIIARNLRGDDLVEKLDEVMGGIHGGTCTVDVNVGKVQANMVYVAYLKGEEHYFDSAKLKDGKATLRVNVPSPISAMLWLDNRGFGYANGHRPDMLIVCLEPGNIHVETNDSVKKATITGGILNTELSVYRKYIAGPWGQLEDLNAQMMLASPEKRKDSIFCNGIWDQMRVANMRLIELQTAFVKQYPDNYGSLEALNGIAGASMNPDVIDPLYNGLSERLRNSETGKEIAARLETARKVNIGVMAPDFTQNDVNDKPVKLSDFRGKYVLLDFWASWCGPCRAENPNYVKAYHMYKDRNFTLLGVSLDRKGEKDAWLAAIRKDGLEWTQVSDLKYWYNEVARLYDVRAVPQNYLIGPDGKIVAKNLRGEALLKKLEEVIKP